MVIVVGPSQTGLVERAVVTLSINRRREALAAVCNPETVQLSLPLMDANGELDAADQPPPWTGRWALRDRSLERQLLERLAESATLAAGAETKVSAVRRLVRRISEPLIIFTEYRDTLMHLQRQLDLPVSILHGGLTREERTAALDDFIEGRYRILLATDAASEGLNLHSKCRVVINLELPWNPMRLEQRIGRIDRIGQSRTVHVFHLISNGTGEEQILNRLKRRVQRARQDIAAADPMAFDERELAELVIGSESGEGPQLPSEEPPSERLPPDRVVVDVRPEAQVETSRLQWTRESLAWKRQRSVRGGRRQHLGRASASAFDTTSSRQSHCRSIQRRRRRARARVRPIQSSYRLQSRFVDTHGSGIQGSVNSYDKRDTIFACKPSKSPTHSGVTPRHSPEGSSRQEARAKPQSSRSSPPINGAPRFRPACSIGARSTST